MSIMVGAGAATVSGLFGVFSTFGFTDAVGKKQIANTVCDCFCNVMSNITETACHRAFDRAFGDGLYPPFDVTLFCGSNGGCSVLLSSANWGFALPTFTTCLTLVGLVVTGVCLYRHHAKKNRETMPINSPVDQ
ncbi:MAG: hypothetical protein JSR46_07515 [Verrucomicrobia bacterium]|nr:hypothetical protein [Verrucomicrobiota bacterium]